MVSRLSVRPSLVHPSQLMLRRSASERRAHPRGLDLDSPTHGRSHKTRTPRPFLKWAGGKTQLLNELTQRVPRISDTGTYHEPFVGGGALFFELARTGSLPQRQRLADVNANLISTYRAVRDELDDVIFELASHQQAHSETHYYLVRDMSLECPAKAAARTIYLNKTCFNGLYRENRAGKFNVPFGRYANPAILDEHNLRAASSVLHATKLDCSPFQAVLDIARAGDIVYFDPPYDPVSATASFTGYSRNGFGKSDQIILAATFRELNRKSIQLILSNSSTDFIRDLYHGFHIAEVLASRAVNSAADRRGKVAELVVTNY